MGPCCYCKKMIYLDWIAERGYHRECHEKYLNGHRSQAERESIMQARAERSVREHEKRRERKRLKRIAEKAARQ